MKKVHFEGNNAIQFYPLGSKEWTEGYKLFVDRRTAKRWNKGFIKAKEYNEKLSKMAKSSK